MDEYHDEALDALESMVEQYLWLDQSPSKWPEATEYHHFFMSAGEFACKVLANQRPERWELTRIGVKRHG